MIVEVNMNDPGLMEKEHFWSRFAEVFESESEYVVGREAIDAIIGNILQQGMLGRVLELACGTGTYTRALVQHAKEVAATDLSEEMLAVAEKNLCRFSNITFDRINCLDIPYQNNTFDTVFMANLIHVICDPILVLNESRRLIKPGGRIIIASFTAEGMTLFNKMGMIYRYLRTWGKPPQNARSFTLAELSDMLASLGFVINEATLLGTTTKALFISAEKP